MKLDFLKPKMPFREARQKALEEWADAEAFDKRGLWLSMVLFAFALLSIPLSQLLFTNQDLTDVGWTIFIIIIVMAIIKPYILFLTTVKNWFNRDIVAIALIVVSFTGLSFDYSLTFTFAALAFSFAALAYALAVAYAVAAAVAYTFAVAYAVAYAFAYAFASVFFALAFIFFQENNIKEALKAHIRKYRLRENHSENNNNESIRELSGKSLIVYQHLNNLMQQKPCYTIGLSGRRGLGKTVFLNKIKETAHSDALFDDRSEAKHIKTIAFFQHTPTEFKEMGFLVALLERFAKHINAQLTRKEILTDILPYRAAREQREKIRLLKPFHYSMIIYCLFIIIVSFIPMFSQSGITDFFMKNEANTSVDTFQTGNPTGSAQIRLTDPNGNQWEGQIRFQPDSSILKDILNNESNSPHSKLFTELKDSLSAELYKKTASILDSLNKLDSLFNPEINYQSWNLKKPNSDKFQIFSTLDSLHRSQNWPTLNGYDSLKIIHKQFLAQLDSIRVMESRFAAIHDSISNLQINTAESASSSWKSLVWAMWAFLFMLSLGIVWQRTREGEDLLKTAKYNRRQNEIALYERTNDLLDRLQYQLSLGESNESGVTAGPWRGIGLSRRKSRNIIRQARPFTIMSLIEEFRTYVMDVQDYLNAAIKEDYEQAKNIDESEIPKLKIIIAIDELDKVIDTQRLHEMLKSIKAIFEIPGVYYILSISEDALGTYQLRHLQTKNEIDSAFTHIFKLEPFDEKSSLAFFTDPSRNLNPALLPAAIVFGGGVPRDMERLAQILSVNQDLTTLQDTLDYLSKEDTQAAIDVIQQNPNLSDEWKEQWITWLEKLNCKTTRTTTTKLNEINKLTAENFIAENPCKDDTAKQEFHHLRTILISMAIKSYIYNQTASHPTPETVTTRQDNPEQYITEIENTPEIRDWLTSLAPLKEAIFNISNNPLGTWESLKKTPKP